MDLHSPHRMWYKSKQTNKAANALTQDFPPFHALRAHEPVDSTDFLACDPLQMSSSKSPDCRDFPNPPFALIWKPFNKPLNPKPVFSGGLHNHESLMQLGEHSESIIEQLEGR